jgi:hypothetical protein
MIAPDDSLSNPTAWKPVVRPEPDLVIEECTLLQINILSPAIFFL